MVAANVVFHPVGPQPRTAVLGAASAHRPGRYGAAQQLGGELLYLPPTPRTSAVGDIYYSGMHRRWRTRWPPGAGDGVPRRPEAQRLSVSGL